MRITETNQPRERRGSGSVLRDDGLQGLRFNNLCCGLDAVCQLGLGWQELVVVLGGGLGCWAEEGVLQLPSGRGRDLAIFDGLDPVAQALDIGFKRDDLGVNVPPGIEI